MPINSTFIVECIECSWQGPSNLTDSYHCPLCDGECYKLEEIEEIYKTTNDKLEDI